MRTTISKIPIETNADGICINVCPFAQRENSWQVARVGAYYCETCCAHFCRIEQTEDVALVVCRHG